MRPLHGDDTWIARQRQHATRLHDQGAHHHSNPSASNNHMSFFVADEATLDSYLEQPTFPTRFRDPRKATEPPRKDDKDHIQDDAPSCSPSSRASFFSQSPSSLISQVQPSVSRPITPIMLGPSCVGSAGSSSSSRRNSFTSSLSDHGHAVSYDLDSDDQEPAGGPTSSMLESGSAPQLIMPSIQMPSRRPFTETGKNFGRLKILLAGHSGVGKTSLLKAIVQTCDHIVHVDPISPPRESSMSVSRLNTIAASARRESLSTITISEVHASTKPYPEWWQELDAPRVSHKRKSLGDSVLERNICFVDTPGYGLESSVMENIMPCVNYIESHLSKVSSDALSDSDLINMLGGDGGCQVDVVLYLVSHSMKPADLEYIRRLTPLTNVIPVLAQAELLSEKQTAACKQEIAGQLQRAGIRPFSFTPTAAQEKRRQPTPSIPYTASSATVSDHDIMDASLLMSPDYVQPLIPTELAFLVERIFSLDGASWLRHSAAKKYLQWRELTPRRSRDLYRPLTLPVPSYASALTHPSLALARISGLQRDNSIAQVHVADWATDLQRSLAGERLRYEALSRGERAIWLTEKLHECMQDGTLVAVKGTKERSTVGRRKRSRGSRTQQHQDPLGLLQVTADLKARGWVALEVLGSLGVVGLAFWISRHAWPTEAAELIDEWTRFWGVER
ncbi:hypothetical protein HD806DRAFT_477225 [Xylariaceae sp. AK1471]|nr:hypothetical protein HD806DRAFT_477225 [Xylariaceae sp. AK1471]